MATAGLLAQAGSALAQQAQFNIPPQPLASALNTFGEQSHLAVMFKPGLAAAKQSPGVSGAADVEVALNQVLQGTGLGYQRDGGTFLITAGESEGGNVVQELVVTAQRKEEAIQTVPIAISAFTQKSLEEQHIEGGFDLLKAIPNVTFSKNNFSGYNFSIRGIGTKAISVTTDPGVAVEFNSTALIRNRLFEQEYFDVERVEVLRGPQGTLHGRNATAGVINVISAKPTDRFEGQLKAEVGNYNSRRASGFINVPLIGDRLDLRFAGSFTDRDGYDFNERTGHPINGRNLWSGRLSIGFKPFERLHGVFVWEHFDENDDRSRTGKQLCHHDAGATHIGDYDLGGYIYDMASFSQGCKPGSLYDAGAFGTPNGLSIPFMLLGADHTAAPNLGYRVEGDSSTGVFPMEQKDPYDNRMQTPDLRVIDSIRDPKYRAKADVMELNFDVEVTPSLTLTSQTAYNTDRIYSFQDFNRFDTVPVFSDTSGIFGNGQGGTYYGPSPMRDLLKGGIFCDPQIGCSDSVAGFDVSQAKSSQVSQEFRIQSAFSGSINFSAGVNYTHYKTLEDYYVFFNMITLIAEANQPQNVFNVSPDPTKCIPRFPIIFAGKLFGPADVTQDPVDINSPEAVGCTYIDPNPIDKINGDGHNYFRSKNPYRLSSAAAFGEVYWQATETLKVTGGLRYTDDRKIFTPVPSQVLLNSTLLGQGTVDKGYPSLPDIKQHWGEFTGRLGVDWRPHLALTDQSLFYAFYSRGYKGGGANPPGIGFDSAPCGLGGGLDHPCTHTLSYPATFRPEFVNAFELGSKNTLLGGSLVVNGDVFFYDYKDYQVSQIKDRTAVNENFDAKVWGAELESVFQPARDTRFNMTFGYQGTRIADGAQSIDLMNRTQGKPGYYVVKPFVQLASNCVAPEAFILQAITSSGVASICPGSFGSNFSGLDYSVLPNGGVGFFADLGGNQLPNAPHWTISLGAQQGWNFLEGWRATLRADAYWQSQSWARVYNDNPYDKLHGWYNANLSLWLEKPDVGLKIEIYAKNILDKTPITDAFLNSDDTALTTNVFVLDPRLIGFSVTKTF